jgi:hypothetical protein
VSTPTIAIRTSGRRCIKCNHRRVSAYLCALCAWESYDYAARFFDNTRSASPTTIGRRNLYPGVLADYRAVPVLPALTTVERRDQIRRTAVDLLTTIAAYDGLSLRKKLGLMREWLQSAEDYERWTARIDANRLARLSVVPDQDHYNYVLPLDPRRWCDDCQGARVHRAKCEMIAMEGRFVGGYPDDGLRVQTSFGKLKTPTSHWQPIHHRHHRRAVARRWAAFTQFWVTLALQAITDMLTGTRRPIEELPRISKELLERIESAKPTDQQGWGT